MLYLQGESEHAENMAEVDSGYWNKKKSSYNVICLIWPYVPLIAYFAMLNITQMNDFSENRQIQLALFPDQFALRIWSHSIIEYGAFKISYV